MHETSALGLIRIRNAGSILTILTKIRTDGHTAEHVNGKKYRSIRNSHCYIFRVGSESECADAVSLLVCRCVAVVSTVCLFYTRAGIESGSHINYVTQHLIRHHFLMQGGNELLLSRG